MNDYADKVFLIEKASGPTSFDVVSMFRKATGVRKVGHTGTLDPLARGLLVLCSGRATRAVEHFMDLEKTYEFDVRLGVETTTADAEGEVVREVPCPEISRENLEETASGFRGAYNMTPPAYSAIKQNGRRMYDLARSGEAPQVSERVVHIYSFDIIGVELPQVTCRVHCSRGTYVRAIATDLGERLGLPAHISRLERTHIGPFALDDAFPSAALAEGRIDDLTGYEPAEALSFMPGVILSNRSSRALFNGLLPGAQDVVRTIGTPSVDGPVRMLDESGTLLAVGRCNPGNAHDRLKLVDTYRLYVDPNAGLPAGGAL